MVGSGAADGKKISSGADKTRVGTKALVSTGIAFVVTFAKSVFLKTSRYLGEKERSYRLTKVS